MRVSSGKSALEQFNQTVKGQNNFWPEKWSKAELPQEGILFCTQFPSLGIFINKKVGFRKN